MVKAGKKKWNHISLILLILMILITIALSWLNLENGDARFNYKGDAHSNYNIREGHPRVFLTKERIAEIRKRCGDKGGAQQKYYQILKEFADKYNPETSKPSIYSCLPLSFVYAIGRIPGYDYSIRSIEEYGKLASEMLCQLSPPADLSWFARYTPLFVACYDWLFPAMSPSQRATVFKNFTSVADKMRTGVGNTGQFRGTHEMYAYYGLAFYGDGKHIFPHDPVSAGIVDKKAKEYCNFFSSWQRDERRAILEATCKGGAYPAGTMYGEAPYPDEIWPLDAWDTASTESIYEKASFRTGFPLFWLYQMLPYRTNVRYDCANGRANQFGGVVRFGDYRYLGCTPMAGPSLNINIGQAQGIAARQNRMDLAAAFNWLVQYQGDLKTAPFGGPFPVDRWVGAGPPLVWDLIFRNGLVEAMHPAKVGLPLAYHFGSTNSGPPMQPEFLQGSPEGAGVVVMRSSWDDPGGTLIWFKASSYPFVHDHRDQGSFQIYKKGWLAIDSGQYEETPHRGNYTSRTVAHNSLLIYSPGESLNPEKADPVWNGYANDGGQRWVVSPLRTREELKKNDFFLGGVTEFESIPGFYDHVLADITRSYNCANASTEGHKPKVSLVTRRILYLHPDEFIMIFDRVTSVNAEYPKRWVLHSIYRPELDGQEAFRGIIPFSKRIPGKKEGVSLRGNKEGGISESRDTNIFTLSGWNFGPSGGRLVCRTLLPQKHITRVVGGADLRGTIRTRLVKPYKEGGTIYVNNVDGFEIGDFVYLGETIKLYSNEIYGSPNWPVDDVLYQGWGKIKNLDSKAKSISFEPYRYGIPALPEATPVIRSGHANSNSFEFMDAEYNQWPMQGEAVANAGPFQMQHGSWRIEIEPTERKKADYFLHLMLPCDKETFSESQLLLKEKVNLAENGDSVTINLEGKKREYKIFLKKDSAEANVTIKEAGKIVLNNRLTLKDIKLRTEKIGTK